MNKIPFKIVTSIFLSFATAQSFAQTKPASGIERKDEINLAIEIPQPPEKFLYRISGKFGDKVYYPDAVPLISFENSEKWQREVGKIAIGTEIKLGAVTTFKGRHFYGVEKKETQGGKELISIVWVDGMFVEISGPNANYKSTVAK